MDSRSRCSAGTAIERRLPDRTDVTSVATPSAIRLGCVVTIARQPSTPVGGIAERLRQMWVWWLVHRLDPVSRLDEFEHGGKPTVVDTVSRVYWRVRARVRGGLFQH